MTSEIIDVTGVEVLRDRVVRLSFDDGQVRDIDLAPLLWGPAFELLADDETFARVRVDSDAGTIVWSCGADLSAHTLYAMSSPATKQRTI